MDIDFDELKKLLKFTSLEKDLILLEDISIIPYNETPQVQNSNIVMIIAEGYIDIGIDLNRYQINAPALLNIMSGQITQYYKSSDDFKCLTLSSSSQFYDFLEIDIEKALSVFLDIKVSPFHVLQKNELDILTKNYYMLKTIINETDNVYRYEIAKHLNSALFYIVLDIFEKSRSQERKKRTTQEALFDSFYRYVQLYYKQERELKFYADKLCLTPKYLSTVIKRASGRAANEWIDSHVILEAKALLKSSKMTVQQISDKLNFPSQSFFGKYFKRHAGVSPMEYKKR